MNYGKILTVEKDSHKEMLKSCTSRCEIASTAFNQASLMIDEAKRDLFKQIECCFPELKGYEYRYDHAGQVITVKYKKEKPMNK